MWSSRWILFYIESLYESQSMREKIKNKKYLALFIKTHFHLEDKLLMIAGLQREELQIAGDLTFINRLTSVDQMRKNLSKKRSTD